MMIRDVQNPKQKKKHHFGLSKKTPPHDLQDLLLRPQLGAAEGGAGANSNGTRAQAAGTRGCHLLPTSPMVAVCGSCSTQNDESFFMGGEFLGEWGE